MAKDNIVTKRGIYLYINGQEIKDDIKSVKAEMKHLINQQAGMVRGSDEYVRAGQKIKALDNILIQHRNQWRATDTEIGKAKNGMLSFSRMSDGFNKYFGIFTAFIGSLTGISLGLSQLKKQRDEFEQKGANLQALTGLSDEAVVWFKQKAKDLSTSITSTGVRIRQEAKDILNAFMLVGSAKPELLGNKEALAEVTEEILILSEAADDMSLKDVVDSTTLAMNQFGTEAHRTTNILAAGSKEGSASVNSIAKALRNSGVAANSANVSLESTVGLIETLAEKGIKDEMAGTGLKTFLLKLQQGADQFNPKVVGMTEALQNLKKENMDVNKMTAMFGQEAYTVSQILIDSAERVEYFTKAVTGTSVATEQAVTNTKTSGAALKQTMNALKLEAMDAVDKLEPVFTLSANGIRYLVKIVPLLIQFVKDHGRAIVELTTIVIAYIAALKLEASWTAMINSYNKTRQAFALLNAASLANQTMLQGRYNAAMRVYNGLVIQGGIGVKIATAATLLWSAAKAALSGNIAKATIAIKALNRMIGLSPWGAVAILVTGAAVALVRWAQSAKVATKEAKMMADINQEAAKSIAGEKAELESLLSVARNEKISKETRIKVIERLNEISPEYLGNLTLENIRTDEANIAVNGYTESLMKNARAKAIQSKLSQMYEKQLEYESKLYDISKKKEAIKAAQETQNYNSEYYENIQVVWGEKDIQKDKADIDQQISSLIDIYNQNTDQHKIEIPIALQVENKQSLLEYLDRERDVLLGKVNKQKETSPFGLVSPIDLAQLETYNKRIEDTSDAIELLTRAQVKNKDAEPTGRGKPDSKKALLALEQDYIRQVTDIKQQYIRNEIKNQEDLNNILYTEEMAYLYAKKELLEKAKESTVEIESQLADKIIAEAQRMTKGVKDAKSKLGEEEEPDSDPLWAKLAQGTEIQMAILEAEYAAGLISHNDYLYRKAELDKRYREEKSTADQQAEDDERRRQDAWLNSVQSFLNAGISFVKAAQSREEATIEKKYKTKLILAEGDNEATAALEEEKEAELLAVRKKYADKAFYMQVLSITAETAVAAMRAYSAALDIPGAGLFLAPVMAAAAIAAGMAQVAVANQQREQAAQMWTGGYAGEGGKYEPKKLIQTHGGEFIANKETVRILRPMFDVMDYAQKTGNVSALTGPDMARAIGTSTPAARGNASSPSMPVAAGQDASFTPDIMRALNENSRVIAKLKERLDEPIEAVAAISGPKGIRKKLDEYDKLIKNASR